MHSVFHHLHSEVSEKLVAALAASGIVIGLPSFILAEQLAYQGLIGTCLAFLGVVVGKWLSNRHVNILARAEANKTDLLANADARKVESDIHEREINSLLTRIYEAHAREVRSLQNGVEYNRNRADTNERITQEERAAKHAIIDRLHGAVLHIRHLELILREMGNEPPLFNNPSFSAIFTPHDEAAANLLNDRANSKTSTIDILS